MINASAKPGLPPPLRLIIFAARRTGSSLLVSRLRKHRQVLMHGELFHVADIRDPDDGYAGQWYPPETIFNVRRREPHRLLNFVECHAEGRQVVGLKVFRDHLRPVNWAKLINWCDVCIILRREDVYAQYRSLLTARKTGRWKGRTSTPPTSWANSWAELCRNSRCAASQGSNATALAACNACPRADQGLGGRGLDGFKDWNQNQAYWYRHVEEALAGRVRRPAQDGASASASGCSRPNASVQPKVVHLNFESDLRGVGRPQKLSGIWHALGLQPPPE